MLIAPMRSLGVTLGLAQRATASGARIFQLLDREPRDRRASRTPPPLPPGSGHVQLRGVTLRYDDATSSAPRTSAGEHGAMPPKAGIGNGAARAVRAVLDDIDLDVAAGHDGRARRRDRLGQDEPRVADLAPV